MLLGSIAASGKNATVSRLLSEAYVFNSGGFGNVTFTRASDAFDPILLTTVSSNVRRKKSFNILGRVIDGDLIEAQSTNYITQSNSLSGSEWVEQFLTTSDTTFYETADNEAYHDIYQTGASNNSLTGVLTFSATIKPIGSATRYFYINGYCGSGDQFIIYFNRNSGELETYRFDNSSSLSDLYLISSRTIPLSGGYYKIIATFTVDGQAISDFYLGISANTTETAYVGDVNEGMELLYPQLEPNYCATSYISNNTTSPVTRAVDVFTVSGSYALSSVGTNMTVLVPTEWGSKNFISNSNILSSTWIKNTDTTITRPEDDYWLITFNGTGTKEILQARAAPKGAKRIICSVYTKAVTGTVTFMIQLDSSPFTVLTTTTVTNSATWQRLTIYYDITEKVKYRIRLGSTVAGSTVEVKFPQMEYVYDTTTTTASPYNETFQETFNQSSNARLIHSTATNYGGFAIRRKSTNSGYAWNRGNGIQTKRCHLNTENGSTFSQASSVKNVIETYSACWNSVGSAGTPGLSAYYNGDLDTSTSTITYENASAISSFSDNGSGKVRVTTTGNHNLVTNQPVRFINVTGNLATTLNDKDFIITAHASTTLDINVAYDTGSGGSALGGLIPFENLIGKTIQYGYSATATDKPNSYLLSFFWPRQLTQAELQAFHSFIKQIN